MTKEYKLRIQVVVTADDDGDNAANKTATDVTSYLQTLNQVYAPANVSFLFDEQTDFLRINNTTLNREFTPLEAPNIAGNKWDHEPRLDSTTHNRALSALARQFPGKLVVIYRNRKKLKKEEGTGYYSIIDKSGGSSGSTGSFVNMSVISNAVSLAHEIGHYLQMWHPFNAMSTIADAAAAIKHYVDVGGHEKKDGLNALDGDRSWVLDTPPDAGTTLIAQANDPESKCGPVGEISIPVTFADQSTKTYTLAPDRSLVMSYFFGCGNPTISPQQARRVRDCLEKRTRHDLISVRPSFDKTLVRAATVTAGEVMDVAMVMVRDGRVATAMSDDDGNLRLIVWDLNADGTTITRRGQATAGRIFGVALCSVGLNLLATAVRDATNQLKVITWRVEENGNLTRLGSAEQVGVIKDLAVEPVAMDLNTMTTASRLADDTLRVDVWLVTPDGAVRRTETAAAGKIDALGPVGGVGAKSFVTYQIDEAGNPKPILWGYKDNKLVRFGDTRSEGPVQAVNGCTVARDLGVAIFPTANGSSRLVAYRIPEDGRYIEEAGTADLSQSLTWGRAPGICRLGTEMVVTVDHRNTSTPHLRLTLWQITPSGSDFVLLDDVGSVVESFSKVAICPASTNLVVTALKDQENRLRLISWRLRGKLMQGFHPDVVKQLFKVDPTAVRLSTGFEDDPDEE